MRIAYLTARHPFPPIGGDRVRVYHTLRHLLRSHEVTLYTLASAPPSRWASQHPDLPGLEQESFQLTKAAFAWNSAAAVFSDLPLQVKLYQCSDLFRKLDADIRGGAFDLLFVHLIRMAEYARPFKAIPRILDMTDSIHLHYTRMPHLSLTLQGLAAPIERTRLQRYEAAVCSWFDHVLLASPLDLAWLQSRRSERNLVLCPTGIEIGAFPFYVGDFHPNRIIFVGKLDYLPNTDAAIYFAREILPRIRRAIPNAEFVVAGWNPPGAVRKLAREPNVRVLPNVADLRVEITQSAVSVAPMRFGSGIQVKILESLALGTPAVATESVIGAFGEEGKKAILVGRNPDDFAEKVVSILKDCAARERLRQSGRRLIERRFQWGQVLAPLDRILDGLAEKRFEARQC